MSWEDEECKEEGGASQEQTDNKQKIKLSSAGLIFKYFGKEILNNIMGRTWGGSYSEESINKIYQKLYSGLIQEVDAMDNGIQIAKD